MSGSYRYDGTFAGLLTVLARVVPTRTLPEAIALDPPQQQSLFSPVSTIETDLQVAEEFRTELTRRLASPGLNRIRLAFLADHPERELLICRYLLLAWEEGNRVGRMLAHPQVAPLWKLAQEVGREAHRYLGFVRFQETTSGFFYAAMAPDHRVLPLIAPHFAARFADQQWVIHDVRHGQGVVHDRHRREWLLLPMERTAEPDPTPGEEIFQNLWRSYFHALAIAERENRPLQQSKVPLKARPWLTEFGALPELQKRDTKGFHRRKIE